MSINLTKLTPVPWEQDETHLVHGREKWPDGTEKTLRETHGFAKFTNATDAAFCAMARAAFDGDAEALAWWEANRKKGAAP